MIITGSHAAKLSLGDKWRTPKDFDVIVTPEMGHTDDIDAIVVPKEIYDLLALYGLKTEHPDYLSLDGLYTLKLSHIFWKLAQSKHINDILGLRKNGAQFIPELFYPLKKYWNGVHANKNHINLKRSKNDFFDDCVTRPIPHDELHQMVMFYDAPLYSKILKDGEEVLLDFNKFKKLSHGDRDKLLLEEITVIALERYLIPSNFKMVGAIAHMNAIRILLSDMMKGSFATALAKRLDTLWTDVQMDKIKMVEGHLTNQPPKKEMP